MEKRLLEVNGIRLCVKEAGAGPDMVLIHGKNSSKENMDRLFDHYGESHHVVSYDVRGHGESDKPAAFTLEDDVADLAALVRELRLDRPVVIGFSMGSYIALRTAEEHPGLFSKVVLIGTKGGGAISSTQKIERDALERGLTREQAMQQVMRSAFAPQTTPEEIAAFSREAASPVRLTADQRDAIDRSLQDFDLLGDAGRVTIPVLVLSGQYDGINPPAEGRAVADALPDATYVEIPDAGHIAFFENPQAVFAAIDAFLG